ncbi:hypothetical protein ACFYY2_04615 [Streptomyces sp. NPDC001822]|uniref:hypothetical protein n=1 Tax=Streptomyces sp. NPDC001822 TaxID=3364614 RepID=UPI003686BCCF
MTNRSATNPRSATPSLHRAVRLYPAAYRDEHGAAITATLADIAEDGRGSGVMRETAAVAGHALRMRVGLDSARPAGRALAGLVPYAVAIATALSAALLTVWPLEPMARDGERTYTPLAYAPWLLVLGCLLAGRWAWARAGAAAALTGAALSIPIAYWTGGAAGLSQNLATVLGLAVAAVLVIASPPDLPPVGSRARRDAALTALAVGVPLVVGSVTVFQALTGPGGTESARPDPIRLFLLFAPLALALPTAFGVARVRYGALAAAALVGVPSALLYQHNLLAEVPYASGQLLAQVAVLTGVAALAVRCAARLRPARRQIS